MRLQLLELEPRHTPAAYDMGGGVLHLSAGHDLRPFADWPGSLNSLEVGDLTYVAPGVGGGPRVAVFRADGSRDRADWFAADPTTREGVVFVATDPPETITQAPLFDPQVVTKTVTVTQPVPVPTYQPVESITYGDPTDPNNWTIFLDYERPDSNDLVERATKHLADLFAPVGRVAITTVRPSTFPANYGTVVIGADIAYTGQGASGISPKIGYWLQPSGNSYQERAVYVDGRGMQPETVGDLAAHEAGHALGLDHTPAGEPLSVMSARTVGPDLTFSTSEIAALKAAIGAAENTRVVSLSPPLAP